MGPHREMISVVSLTSKPVEPSALTIGVRVTFVISAELLRILSDAAHGERLDHLNQGNRVHGAGVILGDIHAAIPKAHLLFVAVGPQHVPDEFRLLGLVLDWLGRL